MKPPRASRVAHFRKIARESRGLPSLQRGRPTVKALEKIARSGGALAQAYAEWHGEKHHTWKPETPTSCDQSRETD